MLKQILKLALVFVSLSLNSFSEEYKSNYQINNYYFQKNEGQLVGINGEKQNDILYIASQQGKSILLTKTGIAYQFVQFLNKDEKEGAKVRTHRVDVELVDANVNAKIEEVTLADGEVNFYAGGENDLTGIKSFKKIIYHDVYPNIDWVLKIDGENFKYDFVVKPGGDISKIKMKFNGEDGLNINRNGQLIIKTSLGDVIDEAPISYQDNEKINTAYLLKDHLLSFKVANYDINKTIILDPSIVWSTYFGGYSFDDMSDLTTDIFGNVYICGATSSTTLIATAGAHEATYISGLTNGYLAKFNASGTRIWSTYIVGGNLKITTDYLGNLIIAGITNSTQGVVTANAHQLNFGGGSQDIFLAKFDSAGVRQWGTYYGGSSVEFLGDIATDATANIYFTGYTVSTTGISSAGAYQVAKSSGTSYDGLIVKFNTSGIRQWGTYYGGTGFETIDGITISSTGSIYICGSATSNNSVTTTGAYQTTLSGTQDGFFAKFNNSGSRVWSTLFGGTGTEFLNSVVADNSGNLFLVGTTSSSSSISTVGAQQALIAGGVDLCILKFDTIGTRIWSTYYGGTSTESDPSLTIDSQGNIYISATTSSTAAIASTNAFQLALSGSNDFFILRMLSTGSRDWCSYFGGTGDESESYISSSNLSFLYFGGRTSSTTGISTSTSGVYQQLFNGGGSDAFLTKIQTGSCTTTATISGSTSICGGSTQLTANSASSYLWNTGATTQAIAATPGTYTVTITDSQGCLGIATKTVNSGSPTITSQPSNASYNTCTALPVSFAVTASGGTGLTYQWQILSGSVWINLSASYAWASGFTTNTLTVSNYTSTVNVSYSLRCVVTCGATTVNSNTAILSILGNSITVQPANITTCAGNSTAMATNSTNGTSYIWYYSSNGSVFSAVPTNTIFSGVNTNTLNITSITSTYNNYQFYCRIGGCGQNLNTNIVVLSVSSSSITTQPISKSVCPGSSTSFNVVTSYPLSTYQWQYLSPALGSIWTNVPVSSGFTGINSSTLVIPSAGIGYHDYSFRCVINGCGTSVLTSNSAVLMVNAPTFTSNPSSVTTCPLSNVSFSVTTSNTNVSYSWQYSYNNSTWSTISNNGVFTGYNTQTLSLTSVPSTYSGLYFRCVISCGSSTATSTSAQLNFGNVSITSQPVSITKCIGQTAIFSVATSSSGASYIWQYLSPVAGSVWTNTGITTNTYSLTASSATNNYQFRCLVSCGNIVTSNAATLTVSSTVGTISGNTSYCSGSVTGTTLTATPGSTYLWSNGQTTPSINATAGTYSVTVTSSSGCVTNASTTVTAVTLPTITAQPTNTSVCAGNNAYFYVNCNISNVQYQWQGKTSTQTLWTNLTNGSSYSGVNTSNLVVLAAPTILNGYQIRCLATCSSTATSSTAVLTVKPTYSNTIYPQICPGGVYTINGTNYTQPGTYTLNLLSSQGCDSVVTVNLSYYATNTSSIFVNGANVNTSQTSITLGDYLPLQLSASLSATNPNIIWTPNTNISSNSVTNPMVNPTSNTQYIVSFNNSNGCLSRDTILVNVTGTAIGTVNLTSPDPTVNYFDTLVVNVSFSNMNNLYSFYSKLKFNSNVYTYLTYIGYNQPGLLGSGASIITTPPTVTTSSYDFGVTKAGSQAGFNGNGIFYTFYFVVKNISSIPNGTQFCFYLDDFSIFNSGGQSRGVTNGGQQCFTYSNGVNVWPGDLDNNKVVNTTDLLRIGTFYNYTGPARTNASLLWVAQPATLWGQDKSTANSSAYYVFADGNGDGIINNADQSSIGFNLGQSHPLVSQLDSLLYLEKIRNLNMSGSIVAIPTPPFVNTTQLPTATSLSINLVNQGGSQLDSLNGISFSVEIDTNVYDLSNITYDYSNSIFGLVNVDFIKIEYVSGGLVNIALTRLGNGPINGNGTLCKMILPTRSIISNSNNNCSFNVNVDAATNPSGGQFTIPPAISTIVVSPTASINVIQKSNVVVTPNPFNESIVILNKSNLNVLHYRLIDAQGKLVFEGDMDNDSYRIDASKLANGVYFLTITNQLDSSNLIYKLVK